MPIKWRQFNLPVPKRENSFPFDGFSPESNGGWSPFMPKLHSEGPAVDIYQDKQNLCVEVSLGGVKPEDVKATIEDNVLTISGQTQEKEESKDKDYFRREITKTTSFRRVIKLPVDVKENQAKAEYSGGILKITVPKAAKGTSKAKEVPIRIR